MYEGWGKTWDSKETYDVENRYIQEEGGGLYSVPAYNFTSMHKGIGWGMDPVKRIRNPILLVEIDDFSLETIIILIWVVFSN